MNSTDVSTFLSSQAISSIMRVDLNSSSKLLMQYFLKTYSVQKKRIGCDKMQHNPLCNNNVLSSANNIIMTLIK